MSRFFRRRKFCRFSAENVTEIDYKDLDTLKQYLRGSRGPVQSISASSRQRSSARVIWRCFLTRIRTISN
jgi:small subunit ribosomal protein S18